MIDVGVVRVGQHPGDVAIAPDGGHADVINYDSDTVSVINTGALQCATSQRHRDDQVPERR